MPDDFRERLRRLHEDIVQQGRRVEAVVELAFEAVFDADADKARRVIDEDAEIDRVDVEIERAAVQLLAIGEKEARQLRMVLTIVKVNNELERIADLAVNIAEVALDSGQTTESVPSTFRVMANSVLGMLRDSNRALAKGDTNLAERVLAFDDTVDRFKSEIMLDAQQKVALGEFSVEFAFRLLLVVKALERIADHCTNICEQIIYLETGLIVRHLPQGWTKPAPPDV